jgi:hypothetical protein
MPANPAQRRRSEALADLMLRDRALPAPPLPSGRLDFRVTRFLTRTGIRRTSRPGER